MRELPIASDGQQQLFLQRTVAPQSDVITAGLSRSTACMCLSWDISRSHDGSTAVAQLCNVAGTALMAVFCRCTSSVAVGPKHICMVQATCSAISSCKAWKLADIVASCNPDPPRCWPGKSAALLRHKVVLHGATEARKTHSCHDGAVQVVLVTLPSSSDVDAPLEVAVTASVVTPRSPCRRLSLLPLGVLHNCTPFDLVMMANQVRVAWTRRRANLCQHIDHWHSV